MDSSIGFRLGAERRFWSGAAGAAGFGADLSLAFTEYNLSQRDVVLYNATVFLSLQREIFRSVASLRGGAGSAMLDDGRSQTLTFLELASDIPMATGPGLRISWRENNLGDPTLREVAVLLVASDFQSTPGPSRLDYALYWGVSTPTSLSLSRSPLVRHAIHIPLRDRTHRVGFLFTTTAHESLKRTNFLGTPGNRRGKSIEGFALGWNREFMRGPLLLRPGVGIEVTNWQDRHSLLHRDGEVFRPGLTGGAVVGGEMELALAFPWAVLLGAEFAYWPGLELLEPRLLVGMGVRF